MNMLVKFHQTTDSLAVTKHIGPPENTFDVMNWKIISTLPQCLDSLKRQSRGNPDLLNRDA